ncbi:DeoR/GlpR family DNA-binding transcription regulator [Luteococcus japonicus]|uniref:Lactose phosphotransferase system repressor n=1 Tax=Luteococcus japonicus LSP_Lj1 TaxID=1255658 RepID=A0A1R4IHN0_9ACTN|nr:DeoR/GlpR family DNA-binding transcription regulator [Luteococcus japonicus]SJN19124.1 Transcriptional repressor of the fructose operon, DeoR family [Luteococcus japonicus LSP_Lj1]
MYAEERRRLIVQLARSDGRVQVSTAAAHFNVTPETIRRDLEVLDRQGILRRVHGGAMPSEFLPLGDLAVVDRENSAAEQKERIAHAALALLPSQPYGSILLDAGTTTSRLAQLIPVDTRLTIFTNSLPIAATLSSRTSADVQLVGGHVRGITQACVGGQTAQRFARLRVDVAFMGTNGITGLHGLSTPDAEEATVKEVMVRAGRQVVVLADSRKFGSETASSFATLDDIDVLITDAVTEEQRTNCTERGIEVVVA